MASPRSSAPASPANAWRPRTASTSGRITSIPEIIDPKTGAVKPDGEFGELVFTSLTKEAMPVIRYRTGDLTRLLPGTARSMRRMEKISGRSDDMMIVRGVNVFPTQIEELVLRVPALSGHYQIVLSREARLDQLEVQVEARSSSELDEARAHGASELAHEIKSRIGVSALVTVLAPGGDRALGGQGEGASSTRDQRHDVRRNGAGLDGDARGKPARASGAGMVAGIAGRDGKL